MFLSGKRILDTRLSDGCIYNLEAEEKQEHEKDRAYWKPLMVELDQLQRDKSK